MVVCRGIMMGRHNVMHFGKVVDLLSNSWLFISMCYLYSSTRYSDFAALVVVVLCEWLSAVDVLKNHNFDLWISSYDWIRSGWRCMCI